MSGIGPWLLGGLFGAGRSSDELSKGTLSDGVPVVRMLGVRIQLVACWTQGTGVGFRGELSAIYVQFLWGWKSSVHES